MRGMAKGGLTFLMCFDIVMAPCCEEGSGSPLHKYPFDRPPRLSISPIYCLGYTKKFGATSRADIIDEPISSCWNGSFIVNNDLTGHGIFNPAR